MVKKNLIIICLLFLGVSTAFSEKIRVGVLNGPSCVPVAWLIENVKQIDDSVLSFERFSDAQSLLPKLIKNEVDIGFLPPNVAAKVYNSANKAIICCGITGKGNLSIITKDGKTSRFSDLRGKTVYVAGQGATPEYLFKYLLGKNGIEIDSANGTSLNFSVPTAQLVPQLISGKIQYALVPEPFSTIAQMKSSDVKSTIDLQKEYEFFTGKSDSYPLTLMVVRKSFAENNSKLLDAFLAEYEKSYEFTLKNPRITGELCEKNDLGLTMQVVSAAIPKSNYTFVSSSEAKDSVEAILSLFLENNPSSIGEKLPDQDFYYVSKINDSVLSN
ncbi:MAG: ABC transporter substrate-binding protein [Treponema sp.]|nr:ABC transporter substrate-binding protein [Treponema sp.]